MDFLSSSLLGPAGKLGDGPYLINIYFTRSIKLYFGLGLIDAKYHSCTINELLLHNVYNILELYVCALQS